MIVARSLDGLSWLLLATLPLMPYLAFLPSPAVSSERELTTLLAGAGIAPRYFLGRARVWGTLSQFAIAKS